MDAKIAAAYKELATREAAAAHLRGIPALQNATRIDQLYDLLCDLNIQQRGGPALADARRTLEAR